MFLDYVNCQKNFKEITNRSFHYSFINSMKKKKFKINKKAIVFPTQAHINQNLQF